MRRNLYQQLLAYKTYLFILLSYSCTSVKFAITSPSQPKAECYIFSKKKLIFDTLVDTSIAYIFGNDMVITFNTGQIEKTKLYQYIVLKSNGVALYSDFSKEPITQENIYSISSQYCFYTIENSELQIEAYDYRLKKFQIVYFKIFPDRIHYYKDKLRIAGGGKSKQDMTFIKSSIKYTKPLVWPE